MASTMNHSCFLSITTGPASPLTESTVKVKPQLRKRGFDFLAIGLVMVCLSLASDPGGMSSCGVDHFIFDKYVCITAGGGTLQR